MRLTRRLLEASDNGKNSINLKLLLVVIGAGVTLTFLGLLVPRGWMQVSSVNYVTSFIESLVPCIKVMETFSRDPSRAVFVWSVGWLVSPVYLVTWFCAVFPWDGNVRASLRTNMGRLNLAHRMMVFPAILFLTWLVLADFHVINFMSFYRGSIFADGFSTPTLLRAPFSSGFGMALYAWLIPLFEATCYWALIFLIANFQAYLQFGRGDHVIK